MASSTLFRTICGVAPLLIGMICASSALADPAASPCTPSVLPVGGNRIWAQMQGEGPITVVFEAGFGNDSTVWTAVEPRIRALGVRTLIYDRAGMGRSSIDVQEPYSLDNDVRILKAVLSRCWVGGPFVFVAHSYGGAIGLKAAEGNQWMKGLVLLDALVPGVLTEHEVDKSLKTMRAQYDIRKQEPA